MRLGHILAEPSSGVYPKEFCAYMDALKQNPAMLKPSDIGKANHLETACHDCGRLLKTNRAHSRRVAGIGLRHFCRSGCELRPETDRPQ